jgi:hypothetical protein
MFLGRTYIIFMTSYQTFIRRKEKRCEVEKNQKTTLKPEAEKAKDNDVTIYNF